MKLILKITLVLLVSLVLGCLLFSCKKEPQPAPKKTTTTTTQTTDSTHKVVVLYSYVSNCITSYFTNNSYFDIKNRSKYVYGNCGPGYICSTDSVIYKKYFKDSTALSSAYIHYETIKGLVSKDTVDFSISVNYNGQLGCNGVITKMYQYWYLDGVLMGGDTVYGSIMPSRTLIVP